MENELKKIFYNEDCWVCERYPNDFEIDDEERFILVDEEQYDLTFGSELNFAWRVVDGVLSQQRYQEDTSEEIEARLRGLREELCFPIVNRGQLWYDTLDDNQLAELEVWYKEWLNAPRTRNEPVKPDWLE